MHKKSVSKSDLMKMEKQIMKEDKKEDAKMYVNKKSMSDKKRNK